MKVKPQNNSVLVRIKNKDLKAEIESNGIVLSGVKQDFFIAEVLDKGDGIWQHYPGEDKYSLSAKEYFLPVQCDIGDIVLVERTFYHEYDFDMRERVEGFLSYPELSDDEFTVILMKSYDVLAKFDSWVEAEELQIRGELFTTLTPKPVTQ